MFDWILVYFVVFLFVFILQNIVDFFDLPPQDTKKKKTQNSDEKP